jgi:hypothetical protein
MCYLRPAGKPDPQVVLDELTVSERLCTMSDILIIGTSLYEAENIDIGRQARFNS